MKDELLQLVDRWEREAAGYLKQAGILVGSKVVDCTAEQTGSACSAGTYRTCANELRQLLKREGE